MHSYTQAYMYTQTHIDKKSEKNKLEKKEVKLESEYETNVYLTFYIDI